jgi:hypothetical protein
MLRLTVPFTLLICASEALFNGHHLDASSKTIEFPTELVSTKTWIMAIPELSTMYGPDGVMMDVEVMQLSRPIPSLDSELGVSVILNDVQASFSYGGRSLFTLVLHVKASAIASIKQNQKISFLDVTFTEADVDVKLTFADPELRFDYMA